MPTDGTHMSTIKRRTATECALRGLLPALIWVCCLLLGGISLPVFAGYDEGWEALLQKDYATALREWQPLAEQGDPRAQYQLAVLYLRGRGVPQDYAEAAKWLRKAAEQADDVAHSALASCMRRGLALPGIMTQP